MLLPPEAEYSRSEYKRDTKYIAGYLLKTSKKCGFVPTSSNNSYTYEVCERDFEPMAQCIVDNSQKISIPSFIPTILVRAIRFRREVTAWYRLKSCADQQHDAFISRLQRTLNILRPRIHKSRDGEANGKSTASKMTALEQGFTKLNLHHTTEDAEDHEEAAEENTGQPVVVEDLPSVPSVEISVEDANLEENFFLDIKTFLKEMQSVRKYVLARWSGKSDLMTKAFVTNIAIDIVRQKEREFDESLSRPPQYPADKFPVWCLPALLLYQEVDSEALDTKQPLEGFVRPSRRAVPSTIIGPHSSLCFYPVYNGLKMLLYDVQRAPKRPKAAVLVHNLREKYKDLCMHPHMINALDIASTLYVLQDMPIVLRRFAEDGLTQGIRHMFEKGGIPFWVTFAMQIQIDINDVPQPPMVDPLNELRRELTKTSITIQEIKTHPNTLVDLLRDKHFDYFEKIVKQLKALFFHDGVRQLLHEALKSLPEQESPRPLVVYVTSRDLFWQDQHLRCGVIIHVLRSLVRRFAIGHDAEYSHVLSVAHLYNISHNLFPDAPHFPDLEFFIQRQDSERFFYGKAPQNITEAQRQLELTLYGCTDAIKGKSDRTIGKIGGRLMLSKCIRIPSHIDSLLENRFHTHEGPISIKEADESTRHLLNSFGDKKQENERIQLFNWPVDAVGPEGNTYHRLYFHKFDNTWDSVAVLRSVMLWFEADAVNLNFCTPKLVLLCSDILLDILDMFRNDPAFKKAFWNDIVDPASLAPSVALRILTLTADEARTRKKRPDDPPMRMDQLREVYNIMQKHYLRPVRTIPDEKTWAGDVCIANLVNTEKEANIGEYWSPVNFFHGKDMLTHPKLDRIDPDRHRPEGPAAASNLYKNWDFGGNKDESRMFNAISRFRGRGPGWSRTIVSRAMEGAADRLV